MFSQRHYAEAEKKQFRSTEALLLVKHKKILSTRVLAKD